MKFESKYLIRWGIPGWVFTTWLLIAGFGTIEPLTDMIVKEANFLKVFGLLITLLSISVPIGYLFHQLYFSWEWISKEKVCYFFKRPEAAKKFLMFTIKSYKDTLAPIIKKIDGYEHQGNFHDDYYQIESLWHKSLLNLEKEKRDYIVGRYKYFLSTIHGLGSLMYSLATSLVLMCVFYYYFADNSGEKWGLAIIIIAHILLFAGIRKNHKYYSRNLVVFQANFLEEMLNAEKDKKDKKEKIPEQTINIKFDMTN
ncbi:hypothetical protein [Bacillus thuringiensis]|uniref:hypothetical protein n=1 Tax=Bacillus thuringiensis TaxID=1428 RepID=UPI000BF9560B|nr:hypothetical protein [Bacillus thuringiensis]PEY76286.1 hypothetical protein CN355_02885 [Bacillus thuringiensis]